MIICFHKYLFRAGMISLEKRPIANAVLDRLIHQSYRIELTGESMRRKRKLINKEID
ncbi:MAG: ATP-binding protein [Bacteroidales bacterium]|nr:ATP-binding protein [Bacteroidales bacterium]